MMVNYILYFHCHFKIKIFLLHFLLLKNKYFIWFSVPLILHFDWLLISKDISCCWMSVLGATKQAQLWQYVRTHGAVGQQSLQKSWSTKFFLVVTVKKIWYESNWFIFLPFHSLVDVESSRAKFCLTGKLKLQASQCTPS